MKYFVVLAFALLAARLDAYVSPLAKIILDRVEYAGKRYTIVTILQPDTLRYRDYGSFLYDNWDDSKIRANYEQARLLLQALERWSIKTYIDRKQFARGSDVHISLMGPQSLSNDRSQVTFLCAENDLSHIYASLGSRRSTIAEGWRLVIEGEHFMTFPLKSRRRSAVLTTFIQAKDAEHDFLPLLFNNGIRRDLFSNLIYSRRGKPVLVRMREFATMCRPAMARVHEHEHGFSPARTLPAARLHFLTIGYQGLLDIRERIAERDGETVREEAKVSDFAWEPTLRAVQDIPRYDGNDGPKPFYRDVVTAP